MCPNCSFSVLAAVLHTSSCCSFSVFSVFVILDKLDWECVCEGLRVGKFKCCTHPKSLMPLREPRNTIQIGEFVNPELLAGAGLLFNQDLAVKTHTFPLWRVASGFLDPTFYSEMLISSWKRTCTLAGIKKPLLSCALLLTRLLLGKYSRNFLIIQLERAAGQPGLVIVSGGERELLLNKQILAQGWVKLGSEAVINQS